MISSSAVNFFGTLTGHVCGFVAKQYVLLNGLETIRKAIDDAVSEVAKKRFGNWLGTIFGFQASLVLALPVASYIGDIVWACVLEVVNSTIFCAAKVTGMMKSAPSQISAAVSLSIRVVASMISFGVKTLIQRYAAPSINIFIEASLPRFLPLLSKYAFLRFYLKPFLSIGGATLLTTPAVLLLADIVGIIVQELLIYAGSRLFRKP